VTALLVRGGAVVLPDGEEVADVVVRDGVVSSIGPVPSGTAGEALEHVDAAGALVAPGFVDLQLNGGFGLDLTSDPAAMTELARAVTRHGVTAFLPTVVSSGAPARRAALDAIGDVHARGTPAGSARALGLHFEGPMLQHDRRGAHDPSALAMVDAVELATWRSPAVALVTLAPELPGALDVIATLRAQGVVVSIGHTDATPAQVHAAVAAGATYVTHLFNAMRPFSHRDPGTVGAVLADERLVAGLICDGVHVDPLAVRLAWRLLGPDRLDLVTDAVAALGQPAGEHRLGRATVVVDERGVRTRDGVLAGSNLAMDQAVRNLVAFTGCTPVQAVRAATATPARVLGRDDVGVLRVGAPADLVVLEPDLRVRATIAGGAVAWRS
jgi:N-acetylglucosamine-6-phosphate deacetylase